ncbi:hypothetical protein ACWEFJ_04200 [Actinosynnema sp. NPDC004786]
MTTDPLPPLSPDQLAVQGASGRKITALFGGIVVGVLIIAGAVWLWGGQQSSGGVAPTASSFVPTAFELRGTLDLTDGATGYADSGECAGYRGYDDIAEGAQVTVYDASGKAVALGKLSNAQYEGSVCSFEFVVGNVPLGENIYQVEVSHRGKVSYTFEQAKAGKVALSLGRR